MQIFRGVLRHTNIYKLERTRSEYKKLKDKCKQAANLLDPGSYLREPSCRGLFSTVVHVDSSPLVWAEHWKAADADEFGDTAEAVAELVVGLAAELVGLEAGLRVVGLAAGLEAGLEVGPDVEQAAEAELDTVDDIVDDTVVPNDEAGTGADAGSRGGSVALLLVEDSIGRAVEDPSRPEGRQTHRGVALGRGDEIPGVVEELV
jgi:hypothetical protein